MALAINWLPSALPLSAMRISPFKPNSARMRISVSLALAIKAGSHFASFRQGMTIVTSTVAAAPFPIAILLATVGASDSEAPGGSPDKIGVKLWHESPLVAQKVEHDLPPVRRAAMLEQIDALPGPKDHPSRGDRNGKLRLQ